MLGPEKRNEPLVREGVYMDLTGDNVLEFRSFSAQESAARELRGRAGWIDLGVFASETDRAAPAGGEEAMQISLPRLPGGRAPSLKSIRSGCGA